MNGFDFHLDRWTKISTVVLGILGAIGTFYVTVYVILPAHERDTKKVCSDYKLSARNAVRLTPNARLEALAGQISQFCPETFDEALAELSDEAARAQIFKSENTRARSEQIEEQRMATGFVSLGRAADYQTSNFRDTKSNEKAVKVIDMLTIGSILKARWSVNLRENDSDTEKGNNKPILTIKDEECVQIAQIPERLRGSFWVKVSLTACPAQN